MKRQDEIYQAFFYLVKTYVKGKYQKEDVINQIDQAIDWVENPNQAENAKSLYDLPL